MKLDNTKFLQTLAKQNSIRCIDIIKLWVAKIKREEKTSCGELWVFCRLFYAKELKKVIL